MYQNKPTTSVLSTEVKRRSASIQCIYCRGGHYSASCNRNSNANELKRVLRDQGRCFLCLRKGHQVQNCDNNARSCRHCNRRHHQSICNKKKFETDQRNTTGRTTKNEEQRVPYENQIMSASTSSRNGTKKVLLQTAKRQPLKKMRMKKYQYISFLIMEVNSHT